MQIKQYDKVLLRSGDHAYIVEIFGEGTVFLADIERPDGTQTDWIRREDIVHPHEKG